MSKQSICYLLYIGENDQWYIIETFFNELLNNLSGSLFLSNTERRISSAKSFYPC